MKVILSFLEAELDLLLKSLELLKIGTVGSGQNFDNLLELLLLESLVEHDQVGSSLVPVVDLVKRTVVTLARWRILVGYQVFDLSGPSNDCGLQSLKKIFVFGCCFIISKIFFWDIKVSLSSGLIGGHIEECHEVV